MCKYLKLECDDLPGGFPNHPLLLEPSVAVPTLSLPVQHYWEPGGTRVHHLCQGGRTRWRHLQRLLRQRSDFFFIFFFLPLFSLCQLLIAVHCTLFLSPWHNCYGWLGVKHQVTLFPPPPPEFLVEKFISPSFSPTLSVPLPPSKLFSSFIIIESWKSSTGLYGWQVVNR